MRRQMHRLGDAPQELGACVPDFTPEVSPEIAAVGRHQLLGGE